MLKQVLAFSPRLREMVTDRVGPPASTRNFRIRIALAAGLTKTIFSETSLVAAAASACPSTSSCLLFPAADRAMRTPLNLAAPAAITASD
ncbi:hypothetical protein D3C86_1520620 [compost metagenome]